MMPGGGSRRASKRSGGAACSRKTWDFSSSSSSDDSQCREKKKRTVARVSNASERVLPLMIKSPKSVGSNVKFLLLRQKTDSRLQQKVYYRVRRRLWVRQSQVCKQRRIKLHTFAFRWRRLLWCSKRGHCGCDELYEVHKGAALQ